VRDWTDGRLDKEIEATEGRLRALEGERSSRATQRSGGAFAYELWRLQEHERYTATELSQKFNMSISRVRAVIRSQWEAMAVNDRMIQEDAKRIAAYDAAEKERAALAEKEWRRRDRRAAALRAWARRRWVAAHPRDKAGRFKRRQKGGR